MPVGIKGDNYDRYYVRMREMDESVLHDPPARARCCPRARSTSTTGAARFPDKQLVYTRDRVADQPFKLVMDGPAVPAGEVYCAHEAPNGELGFYLVSDGSGTPYKVHVRSPSFVHMGGAHRMLDGYQLADIVPDLRLDQHDRRGVRPMKHLIPEFERCARAFPTGFESSLVLPCLRRIQEDRGYVADERHRRARRLPRRAAHPDRGGAVLLHAVPARADRPLAPAGLPQHLVLDARRRARDRPSRAQARHRARARRRRTAASRCRRSNASARAAPRR